MLLLAILALGIPAIAAAQESSGVNRAGLVIQSGDSQPVTYCVSFNEESITGMDLLERSGLPLIIDPTHALGAIVCSIDAEGCAFPSEACFCQCQGTPCRYWNYYYLTDGEWQYGHLGASTRALTDGDVDAWVWGDTRSSRETLPHIGFDEICSPIAAETVMAVTPSADSVLGDERTAGTPLGPSPLHTAEGDLPATSTMTSVMPTAAPELEPTRQTAARPTEPRAETAPGGAGTPMCSGALALGLAMGLMAARGRQRPEPVEGQRPEPVEGQRPEPVEGQHPEPVEGQRPEPVEGQRR